MLRVRHKFDTAAWPMQRPSMKTSLTFAPCFRLVSQSIGGRPLLIVQHVDRSLLVGAKLLDEGHALRKWAFCCSKA